MHEEYKEKKNQVIMKNQSNYVTDPGIQIIEGAVVRMEKKRI